jgi:hypothetical protein
MKKLPVILIVSLAAAVTVLAQHGGKAEPKRIEFGAGRTSTILSTTLGADEEMEYVFSAKKGQRVTITNPSTGLFDVRIFSEENNVETEFDSSRTFSLMLPADGDYNLFVRKKRVKTPRRARSSITLSIK